MAFGNDNDFIYLGIDNTTDTAFNFNQNLESNQQLKDYNASLDCKLDINNHKIFGQDADFRSIVAQNVENTPQVFGNDDDFIVLTIQESLPSTRQGANAVFGDESTFLSYTVPKQGTADIHFQDTSSAQGIQPAQTFNSNPRVGSAQTPTPFGNDSDFSYYGIDEQYDAQDLLALYHTTVESAGIPNRDCGRIDIGNPYSQYEIQRPCDMPPRLYARFCPCKDDRRPHSGWNFDRGANCGHDKRDCDCGHRPTPPHPAPCPPKKHNAEKLARKIYQQIAFASTKVASLIPCAPCEHRACELGEIKRALDALALSMLAVHREICHSEPIFIHEQDAHGCEFEKDLGQIIRLMSIIIQNVLLLQKLPESKCVENALVVLTFGLIAQQNRLLAL